jgi:outer membrane protein OmpA-like peptidoglycan-associated protein
MKRKLILAALLISSLFYFSSSNSQFIQTIVSLTGFVTDEVTHKPINITMEAYDEDGKRVHKGKTNAIQNGYYYITGLKPGKKYTVQFEDFDYFVTKYEIEIPNSDKYAELSKDFIVKPKRAGMKFFVHVPPFELNKSKVRIGADLFLNDEIKLMKFNKTIKFEISCFPDNDIDKTKNARLTEDRVNSLKQFFVNSGIDAKRIAARGFDSTDPDRPPPMKSGPKGKRYIGSTYLVVVAV